MRRSGFDAIGALGKLGKMRGNRLLDAVALAEGLVILHGLVKVDINLSSLSDLSGSLL